MSIGIVDYKADKNNIVNKIQKHIVDIHHYSHYNLDNYLKESVG
jgi:hypothetical protein